MSEAREGGRSSKDHSQKTGLGADEWGTSYPRSPALSSFQVSLLLRTLPWLFTALWIKSKLLSLVFEDKVLTLSSQHPVLTSATHFLQL